MGSFLETITQLQHEEPSLFYQKLSLISEPIERIKEHYGLFKSICDSFLITKEKYLEIFESSKNLTEIWDKEQTNKLDALELFTGLVVYSHGCTFKQKLKFLFVIFDFNEIKSLSFVDLEYATLCLCNATFKILGKNAKANETEIVSWLKGYFDENERINITKLYAFCIRSPEIKRFFEIITKEALHGEVLKEFIGNNYESHNFNNKIPTISKQQSSIIPTLFKESKKELEEKLEWHRQFSKKLAVPYNPTNYLHRAEIEWLYGVRISQLKNPFILIEKNEHKNESELLYTTSTFMVLYNLKTNKQRYYTGHKRMISAFVYNESKNVIISASESLCHGAIHVWLYESLECKMILDTYKPVKGLALLGRNEEMLVVICSDDGGGNNSFGVNSNLLNNKPNELMKSKHQEQSSSLSSTTIMIFSLSSLEQEQQTNNLNSTNLLLYSYSYESMTIDHIANIYTTVDFEEVGVMNVWDCFVAVCGGDRQGVVFSEVEGLDGKDGWNDDGYDMNSNNNDNKEQELSFNNNNNNNTIILKTTPYEYYEEHTPNNYSSHRHHHEQEPQIINNFLSEENQNTITCTISLYINEENPSLRTLINSEESLSLFIITGHKNGQLKCVVFNDGQFGAEEVLFDCEEIGSCENENGMRSVNRITEVYKVQGSSNTNVYNNNTNNREDNQKINPPSNPHAITCLHHTSTHILFSHTSRITIFPLSFLLTKDDTQIRTINLNNFPHLKLFNPNIEYFTCLKDELIIVTENEGDFIYITDRRVIFSQELIFTEVETIKRIKTLTKIDNDNHSQSMCLLEKPESSSPLLYLTTQDRRILIINTFTKEVENVWEINSPNDKITVIDAIYTDEDVLYFICGCQSGKLYIRIDNEENPKFYDCSSQIIDVKISKDASYLLVSTADKYLYFFTQINKNFSSPRKLHFENEIPVCINFLDSNKMFTVNTSAKNVYVIEIPQLKHKNIQKESERISISKMKIMYPSVKGSYENIFSNNNRQSQIIYNSNSNKFANTNNNKSSTKSSSLTPLSNESEKHTVYTKSYLGGEMKYFLVTLNTGELMFFESRQHLSMLSYVVLKANCGEIGNLSITEDQQEFYTLGRYDNTLIQWHARSSPTIINMPQQSIRNLNDHKTMFEIEEFEKMKEISCYYKLLNSARNDDIYLFSGTKSEKLNEALRRSLAYMNVSGNEGKENIVGKDENSNERDEENKLLPYMPKYKLNLRQPNISLESPHIYGLECYKRSSVAFWGENETNLKILYFTSRFLLSLDISSPYKREQQIIEEEKYKLSCFVITEENKILYALAEPNTKIRLHGEDDVLWTTHEFGIIHMAVYKEYVLSYGILSNSLSSSYSVNLHNYKTRQLISKRTTELKIHEFIFINEREFISLNEIRIWKDMYPSEKIGKATAGILMPNLHDICLGTDNGSISILNTKKGIFNVVTKAHESDITCITINKFNDNNGFEILTVSKDDKIKIWNEKFSCKLMINLREELLKNIKYLPETEDEKKSYEKSDRFPNLLTKEFSSKQSMHNYKSLNIRGIDSRKGRILIYLATGEVYVGRFTLINRQNFMERTLMMDENSSMRDSDDNGSLGSEEEESIELEMQKNPKKGRKNRTEYEKEWEKVIESHCCETESIFKKSLAFTIHPILPIITSVAGNDKKLIFRNYETSEVIDTYFSEESRITCLKYSKKGHLLILGFKNGNVKVYSFDVKQKDGVIKGIEMKFSQKFSIKEDILCEAINIEVSERSVYFSVSFVGYNARGDSVMKQEQEEEGEQEHFNVNNPGTEPQQSLGFINIYKLKSQKSTSSQSSSYEETYYSLIDTIRIKELDSSLFSTGKYIRCVYEMEFVSLRQEEEFTKGRRRKDNGNDKKMQEELKESQSSLPSEEKRQQQQPKQYKKPSSELSSERSPLILATTPSPSTYPEESICLILYEQYINENMIKVNNSQRDKFSVYLIEERTYLKKEFEELNWARVKFAPLINVLQLNRFMSEIVLLGDKNNCGNGNNNSMVMCDENGYEIEEAVNMMDNNINNNRHLQQLTTMPNTTNPHERDAPQLTITSMCYYKNSTIIYGGTHGKLHLVRKSSLLTDEKNSNLSELKQHEMATCKTYPAQASFISRIELSSDQRYLFVSGQLDETIMKYNIIESNQETEIDYQEYDTYRQESPEIYTTKEKFYTFINSLSPLREGIRNVLEDVEGFDSYNYSVRNKSFENEVGLEVVKIVGRRAYDRVNNLFVHQDYLIYTLGPNLILQNITDPFVQKLLPSDPNPLSHSPQISTIHMKKNSNLLILATEEESARLFVWDIRAMICLSEMQVNCSIIYGLKLIGDRYAVFYGINSMYQLVIQVVDWRLKRVVALCNLLHSAVWKVRDVCVVENSLEQEKNIDENNIRFVTCGVQHLSEWTIKSNTLIEKHFVNPPSGTTFTVISNVKSTHLILTGCERGNIYVWKNLELLQQLKVHTGPIRSIEYVEESNTLLTGGMDSILCVLRFEDDELVLESGKSLNPKGEDISNTSNVDESSRGEREKELMPSQLQQGSFLTEFDIQSIIHTPSTSFFSSPQEHNIHSSQTTSCTFFTGTRSGDIYFCEYNMTQKEFISMSHISYGQDHETIVSTAFANKEEILYTLTISGKLEVWELKNMEKIFSYKFMKSAKRVYIYNEYLLICFEKEVIFIEIDIRDKIIKIDETLTLLFDDGIVSECTLSYSQQYLAIGLHANETNEILIYELAKKNLLYRSPSLKYEIEFLDFSTDEKYLLYKDKFEEIGMVYLVTLKRINTIFVEMKLEWQTEGLRISPKAQRIYSTYNCENRITTIAKLAPNYILVGDEMGTLRVFQYPPDNEKLGELHSQCYTQHMNKINCIKQHRELTYVVTTAVADRSMILWRKYGMG